MNKIVIANWKNHPETLKEAKELFEFEVAEASKYEGVKTVICPPEQFLKPLLRINAEFVGAQDVFWNLGDDNYVIKYALVGHSDRRQAGDTDEKINDKLKVALASGAVPFLLVGEKEKGDNRQEILERQLFGATTNLMTSQVVNIVIVYEPVWAISTNPDSEPDKPENTLEAYKIINNFLFKNYSLEPKAIFYGGSVNQSNVADFLKHPEINGAVIGGASLRKEEFGEILKIVSGLK
ncbi:MAG: triose-phosphate isomerase [Candidatus Yanofskybacteria bacterium]|nr:triose-phosphate isomerase [Candidatus Yanofskybacteria bacterium]